MKTILVCILFLSSTASAQTDGESIAESARRAADAAEKAADAAEQAAKAVTILVSQTAPPAPTPEAPPSPNKLKFAGVSSLSAVYLTGNSNAFTGSLGLQLSLLTGPWTASFKGTAIYGEAQAAGSTKNQVTASNGAIEARGSRDIAKYMGLFVLGGAGFDRVAKIESRGYGEGGASVIFIKREEGDLLKTLLKLDLGVRYQHEEWFQYYPDASGASGRSFGQHDMVFIRVGESFRYAIDKRTVFSESVDILPDVLTAQDVNLHAQAQLSVKLVGPLSLGAAYLLKFDNLPPPGASKIDSQFSLSADISF